MEAINLFDGVRVKINKICEIVLEPHYHCRRLTKVTYVPHLNSNMVSLGKLVDDECTIEMHQGAILVVEQAETIMKSTFVLEASVKHEEVLVQEDASLLRRHRYPNNDANL